MGSIVLTEFSKKTNRLSSKPYTYVDMSLDLKPNFINNEKIGSSDTYRDVEVSYDEFAIVNSLVNIFNTIPGQRFLIPNFGANLLGYLFQPITDSRGLQIGREIERAIELWEPRVTIEKILVTGFPDEQEYKVEISIIIDELKIKTSVTGVLSREGFRETVA